VGKIAKEVENLEDLFVIVGLGNPGQNMRTRDIMWDLIRWSFFQKDMILGWESLSTRLLSAMER